MIRVAIFADGWERARGLAEVLATEHEFEITHAGVTEDLEWQDPFVADVVVVAEGPEQRVLRLGIPVVVLTERSDGEPIAGNLRARLSPDSSPHQIAAAVYAAASGLVVLTAAQVRQWLRTQLPSSEDEMVEHLTPREMQVLRMLSDGLANKEIAAKLTVSDHTVKFHVSQILAKLGASTRAEAVAVGMRRGLVPV